VYRNDSQVPQITGLVSSVFFAGGAPAIFPAIAQDAVEVAQGSFDLTYGAIGRLIYERPSPSTATLFDDAITIPNPFNLTAPAFIRSLQTVTGPAAPNAPVAGLTIPSLITARVYNGMAASITSTPIATGCLVATPCVSHADATAGVATGSVGASAYTSAAILPTQVQAGVDFTTLPAATAIAHFGAVSYTTGGASGGNVTATIRVRATGASGTFQNPFAGGLALVERRSPSAAVAVVNTPGDAFLRPVTATFTPQFVAPFPTLDNGLQRDYEWTFTVTRPTGSIFNFHVLGLSAGFDALASRETQITFTANLATTLILPATAPTDVF
jgi:hypothetical protein